MFITECFLWTLVILIVDFSSILTSCHLLVLAIFLNEVLANANDEVEVVQDKLKVFFQDLNKQSRNGTAITS